jgi:hypothetical protein
LSRCSYGIVGVGSKFEYWFDNNKIYLRDKFCFCKKCRAATSPETCVCKHADYVGTFTSQTFVSKGERSCCVVVCIILMLALLTGKRKIKGLKKAATNSTTSDYEVERIVGRSSRDTVLWYEVKWVGYEETTWLSFDRLNCDDLIEEYEMETL